MPSFVYLLVNNDNNNKVSFSKVTKTIIIVLKIQNWNKIWTDCVFYARRGVEGINQEKVLKI